MATTRLPVAWAPWLSVDSRYGVEIAQPASARANAANHIVDMTAIGKPQCQGVEEVWHVMAKDPYVLFIEMKGKVTNEWLTPST